MTLFNRVRPARVRPPYKLLSLLLQYPDIWLVAADEEICRTIASLPPSPGREAITRFYAYWTHTSPTERAQRYVETFDFQKRCSLHLSYYLQGDKRQRGAVLLRLKRLYAAAGLVLQDGELPDYLPVLLEFAAFAPPGYGDEVLREFRAAIELVRTALHDLDSPYAHLLDALCDGLSRLTPVEMAQIARLMTDGPPDERVGLDSRDGGGTVAPPPIMPGTEARR